MTPPSACPPDPNRLQATPCPKSRMGEPSTRLCSGNPSAGMPTRRRTSAGKVSTGKKDFSPLGPGSTRAPSRIHGSFAGVVDHPTCLPRPATGNAARPAARLASANRAAVPDRRAGAVVAMVFGSRIAAADASMRKRKRQRSRVRICSPGIAWMVIATPSSSGAPPPRWRSLGQKSGPPPPPRRPRRAGPRASRGP